MKISQKIFENGSWRDSSINSPVDNPDLVLCFGDKNSIKNSDCYPKIIEQYPNAKIVVGSTAGEISNEYISDNSMVITALKLEKSRLESVMLNISDFSCSLSLGKELVGQLKKDKLKYIFVLSDGSLVNGSDLVMGMNEVVGNEIPISGALAGDGMDFNSTLVGMNDQVATGNVVAIGFYGDDLNVGFGSKGGWGQFGPLRTITKSDKNILYEIDDGNALDLYKKYLGKFAEQLPRSALLFPLSVKIGDDKEVVRTILTIDQKEKTMTFAGNVPEGAKVRFMKANLDNLVDAASEAAKLSSNNSSHSDDSLSILISCVGRKIIFGNRIEEEFEAAKDILGDSVLTGLYSYGEISPFSSFLKCQLHNQTMTVTHLSEN